MSSEEQTIAVARHGNAEYHSSFDDGPGGAAATKSFVTQHGSCYTLSVKLSDEHRGLGPDGYHLHPDLVALKELASAWSQILPLAHVSVDYQGSGSNLLRSWSCCPQTGVCESALLPLLSVLADLNPPVLSVSGISLTALDISMISRYIGSLRELKILPPSEVNPSSLRYLTHLPHLRRLTVDASMCCFPSNDNSEEYWSEEMVDALTELCQGPFGCGGHVTLLYACKVEKGDVQKACDKLVKVAASVKQRLHDGAQGEDPRVVIVVQWVKA